MLLEHIIIFSVLGTVILQTLISFILLWKSIKELCSHYQKDRVSQILSHSKKILPLDSSNQGFDNPNFSEPSNIRNTEHRLNIDEIS